jgi:hypothetical protein
MLQVRQMLLAKLLPKPLARHKLPEILKLWRK